MPDVLMRDNNRSKKTRGIDLARICIWPQAGLRAYSQLPASFQPALAQGRAAAGECDAAWAHCDSHSSCMGESRQSGHLACVTTIGAE